METEKTNSKLDPLVCQSFDHLTGGYTRNLVHVRLAILGAPGSGKSTLSAGLLYFSKLFLFRADAVPEVAKWHVYKGTDFSPPEFELQKYEEQQKLEDLYPRELEILICEAPLVISAVYASFYLGDTHPVSLKLLEYAVNDKHRYTHFIVSRKLLRFESFGRNEDESQSEKLHFKTLEILEKLGINYTVINRYDEHLPLQVLAMVGAIRQT
jgi:nicotinamide riboside kinase